MVDVQRIREIADEEVARLEKELAFWRFIQKAATETPAALDKLDGYFHTPKANGIPSPEHTAPARQPEVEHWQRIWNYLIATGNEWTTIRKIMEGTGLKRNPVTWVLYTSGRKYIFEGVKSENGRTKWRVKDKYTDPNSVPLLSEKDEEPQNGQPPEEPVVADASEVVEELQPARAGPTPKHRPANWSQN